MPVIKLRNSQTQAATPVSLDQGEVAVNERDGVLYYRDSQSTNPRALIWSGGAFTGRVSVPSSFGPGPLFTPSLVINNDTTTGIGGVGASTITVYAGGTTYTFSSTQCVFPANNTPATPAISFNGDLNTGIYAIAADTLGIATGGTARIAVSPSGFVGIGTTSPTATLHVVGSTRFAGPVTEGYVSTTASTAATISLTNGTVQNYTLTGNVAFTMPTPTAGQSFTLLLRSGTGNFTATFANVRWPSSIAPTVTTAASRLDIFTFVSDGTVWYGSAAQNYSP